MTCTFIGSAAMTNVRRIQRCLVAKEKQENESRETKRRADITWDHKAISFCVSIILPIKRLVGELALNMACFGC
jgi:hypothetical protein